MADTRAWPQGPRHRLPRTVTPFALEAATSYAARLAHANHIGVNTLRRHLAETGDGRPRPDWLATISGHPVSVIKTRLRGLAGDPAPLKRNLRRPLCRRCMAGKGIHEPVYCYLPDYVTVCHQHRRWIGPPARTLDDHVDLQPWPQVLRAARTHHRLTGQYTDIALGAALRDARHILMYWARAEHREKAAILHTGLQATVAAYPEVIAVAATLLMSGPGSETRSHPSRSDTVARLIDHINRRLAAQHIDTTPVEQWVATSLLTTTSDRSGPRGSVTSSSVKPPLIAAGFGR